jgi:hypothetical protein
VSSAGGEKELARAGHRRAQDLENGYSKFFYRINFWKIKTYLSDIYS